MFVVVTLKRLLLILLAVIMVTALLVALRPDEVSPAAALNAGTMPTLIIDAGHGGEDGGAVSVNGVSESTINLDIALKMADLSELLGFPTRLTREGENLRYPDDCKTVASRKRYDQKQRVELINACENALVVSIHQNSFPSARPHGPQTFYTEHPAAKELAGLVQESLNATLCPDNRRVASPVAKNIFLMKSIDSPGVLVECGFVSNKNEAQLLETEEYRLKIACAVISAYAQSTKDR